MASMDSDIPIVNLASFMSDRMKVYGSSPALVDSVSGQQYTYADVIDRIQRLAAGLREYGVRRGDVLCMLTKNHIDYPIAIYALNLLGASLQTASPDYTDDDLERRFRQCRTKFIITYPDEVVRIRNIAHRMKLKSFSLSNNLNKIIVIGKSSEATSLESLLESDEEKITEAERIDPKSTAAILISSSGTTGLPKNVQLTHYNVVANLIQMAAVYRHKAGMCCVGFLPMYHHYGIIPVLSEALYNGLKLVIMPEYRFQDYISLIKKHKAEILHMVPPVVIQLVKDPRVKKEDLASVVKVHSAAAPLSQEVAKLFTNKYGLSFVYQTYGLSETGVIGGDSEVMNRDGSTGKPTLYTQYKVVDPESGRLLLTNQIGELLVRGPQVMIGYLNDAQANKDAFDNEGYFKTGDIGLIDDAGFIYVVDRLKELIKYKGLQVPPAQLEDLLMKHPAVADAAVIGVPDETAGEIAKAFIVTQPNTDPSEIEICKYVEGKVSPHMRLRGGVTFVQSIPKSPSGKILRRLLKEKLTNTQSKL